MTVLGVIPARGGSKGIARKNIVPMAGRPLLAYTIDTARAADSLDRFVVSTDDAEIAEVARQHGAGVVDRPRELATDEARTEPVLLHAADTLAAQGFEAEIVVTLEPTSPLRTPALVDRCVSRYREGGCDAVLTVVPNHAIVGRLHGERFEPFIDDAPRRRQEREPLYEESSTVYVTGVKALRETGHLYGTDAVAVVVDPQEAVDIDSELDLRIVEALLHAHAQDA